MLVGGIIWKPDQSAGESSWTYTVTTLKAPACDTDTVADIGIFLEHEADSHKFMTELWCDKVLIKTGCCANISIKCSHFYSCFSVLCTLSTKSCKTEKLKTAAILI